jgi:hypothetical protein
MNWQGFLSRTPETARPDLSGRCILWSLLHEGELMEAGVALLRDSTTTTPIKEQSCNPYSRTTAFWTVLYHLLPPK